MIDLILFAGRVLLVVLLYIFSLFSVMRIGLLVLSAVSAKTELFEPR